MNTPQQGKFRHIVFRDGETWYAVALEFNIVESSEDPKLALFNLFDAVTGYIESSKKLKGSRIKHLNQKPDKEYEALWNKLESGKGLKKSPYQVYMHGTANV